MIHTMMMMTCLIFKSKPLCDLNNEYLFIIESIIKEWWFIENSSDYIPNINNINIYWNCSDIAAIEYLFRVYWFNYIFEMNTYKSY